LVAAAPPAGARQAWAADDPAAQAEALIREGVRLRKEGRDEQARANFQKAYDVLRSPRTEGQLGLGEMAVGYWLESERHLAEALESPEHPWVAKNRRALEQALVKVRASIGELALSGAPAGAAVSLNGRPSGTLPLAAPLRAPAGKVEIELRAPGYTTASRTVRVRGGERAELNVTLERERTAENAAAGGAAGGTGAAAGAARPGGETRVADLSPRTTTSGDAGGNPQVDVDSHPPMELRRKVAWGMAAAAGAALVVAGIETVVWQKNRIDFGNHKDLDGQLDCYDNHPDRGGTGCQGLYDAAHRAELFAIVGYVVTGALGATSAVLFLSHPKDDGGTRVACAPVLGNSGLSCRFSF
jgi:hypothetical protein